MQNSKIFFLWKLCALNNKKSLKCAKKNFENSQFFKMTGTSSIYDQVLNDK